ncbi:hypothetical protein OL548_07260 [Lysinibacillus sp. MHQ-1]|nr:hypothetical protein OL548_07260 [Lysinibacillus sp. MHQ-1]
MMNIPPFAVLRFIQKENPSHINRNNKLMIFFFHTVGFDAPLEMLSKKPTRGM